ncbi:X-ray radiation resistance-associated protein 1 isoform X2 [Gallus gallus]|uniref:X-ray radiation resistance-associated protein 1 isoform X2 n=1 Tax=Gallus gallus TaxID=9031 RepID=UPI001AE56C88|nr:X-ray radiation resistance-associated protein 1 isoform X2 [Gallus gallus]
MARRPRGERAGGWGGHRDPGSTAIKMATAGLYKMADGSNYAANCFPARNILRNRREAGHCLLAHIATPQAWAEQGITREAPEKRRKPPSVASAEENDEDHILDEPFLMKHHCLKHPSDLCSVNISGQNLVSAKEDDFEKFDCVAFINAAENLLTLEPFRKFPGLRELELPLNGLRNLKITPGEFKHLEDLDLSYNNLSPEDIWVLGDLSQLKVLRLTANGLRSLPPDLAGSWGSAHLRFQSLEVLLLDDNRLSDPGVFVSLSHLCSLRELNLDRNRISAVPYLHQAESMQFSLHPTLDDGSFRAEWYQCLGSLWQQLQPPQHEAMEVPAELETKKEVVFNSDSQGCPMQGVAREGYPRALKTLPALSTCRDVCALFPVLEHLSLAFNKIMNETALLPVAFFPHLKQLTFHNNPLTTTHSGHPPLLTRLLQQKLGIQLVHHKSPAARRWHFSIPLKASRKVSSHLPKVKKQPLMLEAPAEAFIWRPLPAMVEAAGRAAPLISLQPLPPISSMPAVGHGERDPRTPSTAQEDVEAFFMTQVEDDSKPLLQPMAEDRLEKRSKQREEGSSWAVPERYKGYEELLGGDTDPDFIEPVGIQKNVQALYYVLKHPLVYRDAKPRLDSMQKPYVPQKKRGRMPDPPARKTKAEVLEGILVAMRNTSTVTNIPLASALQKRKSSPKTYQEALRLMEELQEVFKTSKELAPRTTRLWDEVPVVRALLAASKQRRSKQLLLPGKKVSKKVPKVKTTAWAGIG